jgi:HK97 family phage major capsid protein
MDRRYAALIQRRADLVAEGTRILDAAEHEERELTEQESERYSAIAAELRKLELDIGVEEQMRESRRAAASAGSGVPSHAAAAAVADVRLELQERQERAQPRPFASLGEQLFAVMQSARAGAVTHKGLLEIQAAAQGLNESVPSEGGFLVQQDFTTELLRNLYDTGVLAPKTRRRPVAGSGLKMNAVDETSRADGSRMGGIQAFWTSEAGAKTGSRPKFRRLNIDLEKLTGLYYATDELLEDAGALQAEVESWFTDEFGFKVDDAILRGTGDGMPLGILNSGALVTVAAEGGQTADTVNGANVGKMFARMPPRSLRTAEWFINQSIWPQLFGMNQANMPIYLPGGNLSTAPFGQLLGRPINPLEQSSAIGDVGDILFMDLQQYLLIEKGGIRSDSSIHVAFLTDETVFRFVLRLNGQPIPISAITPFKGTDSMSPFVALAAR